MKIKGLSIFISYTHSVGEKDSNNEFIDKLVNDLMHRGYHVFSDVNLQDKDMVNIIKSIISNVDSVIFVWDSHTLLSSSHQLEWNIALRSGKRIIPIIKEGEYFSSAMRKLGIIDCRQSTRYTYCFDAILNRLEDKSALFPSYVLSDQDTLEENDITPSLNIIYNMILEDVNKNLLENTKDSTGKEILIASLELFLELSARQLRLPSLNADSKKHLRVRRRQAKVRYANILSNMPKERFYYWEDLSLPKTNNLALANELVKRGIVSNIEDIYVRLTPEQELSLKHKKQEWDKKSKHEYTDYPWLETNIPSSLSE